MQIICPINERESATEPTRYSKGPWQIVRCQQSGFVFLANPPKTELLEEGFAWEKTYAIERTRRQQDEPLWSAISTLAKNVNRRLFPRRNRFYELLKKHLPTVNHPLVILDVGCGAGGLVAGICCRMQQEGLGKAIPEGIEISKALSHSASQRLQPLGGKVHSCSALEGARSLADQSVDVILMSSFLEHETRPLPLLRELRRAMRPEGLLILKVPNFACWNRKIRGSRWCGFRYPDHVNYFTPATLTQLAKSAELPIARQTIMDHLPLSDNMYMVMKKAA